MNSRLRTPLLLVVLFLCAWVPRVVGLNAFVTIDERKWLARSANFLYAVAHGDFAHTFQREHPGVTVMWAGALGILQKLPDYAQKAPGYFTWNDQVIEAWIKANTQLTPLELLTAGRWWIVLGVALLLALAFLPLRRLLGEPLAALAVLFVAWAPWSVALSRQLHPDGFVASLIFVALVFFLSWLYGGRRWRDLMISGVLMGLAWLTKTPAAFLVPAGAVLIAIEWWMARHCPPTDPAPRMTWQWLWGGYVVWGIVASATFFLLWPSMWLDPLGTFAKMAGEMEDYVGGHVNANFFLGQITDDPGIFFYPIAYFFRITPATTIGLIAAGIAAFRHSPPWAQPKVRRTALGFLVFAVIFIVLMTIPAKKFDRYILPAFPGLDVIAALGWAAIALWAARKLAPPPHTLRRFWLVAGVVIVVGLGLLHSFFTALHAPYYLTYFNPLAGGSLTAPRAMFVGWGEGLDQVGEWLNQQPNAEQLHVVSWYHDGPLSYFFEGEPTGVSDGSSLSWLDNDFVVLYANQIQRDIPTKEMVDWYLAQTPAATFNFGGLELARIYDMRGKPLPAFTGMNVTSAADFGGKIRLLAHQIDKSSAAPGETIFTQLYLRSLAQMQTNYNVLVRVVGPDGAELWREEGWPWGAATDDWVVGDVRPDGHKITIPANAAPGLYKVTVAFYDPQTLDNLPVTDPTSGASIDASTRDVALVRVGPAPAAAAPLGNPWQFADKFVLSGATLPPALTAGATLSLSLQWDGLAPSPVDYTTFVHVVGPDGAVVAQHDQPPLNGFAPTHLWTPGIRVVDDFAIPLPPDLAPGAYTVRTGMYTAAGRLPVSRGGQPAGDYAEVGQFEVK